MGSWETVAPTKFMEYTRTITLERKRGPNLVFTLNIVSTMLTHPRLDKTRSGFVVDLYDAATPPRLIGVGFSYLNPTDKFDHPTGEVIAVRRAILTAHKLKNLSKPVRNEILKKYFGNRMYQQRRRSVATGKKSAKKTA